MESAELERVADAFGDQADEVLAEFLIEKQLDYARWHIKLLDAGIGFDDDPIGYDLLDMALTLYGVPEDEYDPKTEKGFSREWYTENFYNLTMDSFQGGTEAYIQAIKDSVRSLGETKQ